MSNWPEPYAPNPCGETYVYLPAQHRSSTGHLVLAWLAAVLTAGYMLPWAIGATRNRTNCVVTALINFFLGWTLIGWVIALVMACGSEPQQPVVVRNIAPQPYLHGPAGPRAGHHFNATPQPVNPYPVNPYRPFSNAAVEPSPTPAYPAYPALPPAESATAEVTMPLPTYGDPGRDPRRTDLR